MVQNIQDNGFIQNNHNKFSDKIKTKKKYQNQIILHKFQKYKEAKDNPNHQQNNE